MVKVVIGLFLLMASTYVCAQDTEAPLDRAFQTYWKADKPKRQLQAIAEILATHPDFDRVVACLRAGRTYDQNVARGVIQRTRILKGLVHPYMLIVPEDYDPTKKYALEVFLHGGVGRPAWEKRDGSWWLGDPKKLLERGTICLVPAAWNESMWWQRSQSQNLAELMAETRRTYYIDENRVYLLGISDGATGAYFQMARNATPWASVFCLIGHAAVLANRELKVDGDFFPANLSNKPLYVVNCEKDFLYPTSKVQPFIQLYRDTGANVEYVEIAGGGHDLHWFADQAAPIKTYRDTHERDPLPDLLIWETETCKRYNRLHWLVINRIGDSADDPKFPTFNQWQNGTIWPRTGSSGRAGVARAGNEITIHCSGVRELTLLLSPDVFDFNAPIRVTVNGTQRHDAIVPRDIEVLLRWAAQDDDPSMLFAAELKLAIP